MSDLIGPLASAAAATIVTAMATDLWEQVKSRVSRLFGRSDPSREKQLQDDLEESRRRAELVPDRERDEALRDIESEWRGVLRHLMMAEPELADEVRALVADFAPAPDEARTSAQQVVIARDRAQVRVAGRDQINLDLRNDRGRK